MDNILLALPAFLFVITIVVFFHELGHFLVARMFGVAVEVFSIGFGREVIGWTDRKGTRWKVSWLPFGGYVKFVGDADASSKPDTEQLATMPETQRKNALHMKPIWQRALVVAAGPGANFVLAIVILTGLFMIQGKPSEPPVVESTIAGAPAVGVLLPGDVIRSVDGRPVANFNDVALPVSKSPGRPMRFVIVRDGLERDITITPRSKTVTDGDGAKQVIGEVGIRPRIEALGLVEAVETAASRTWWVVEQTVSYIGRMVSGRESTSQLHGPLGILSLSGNVAGNGGIMDLLGLAAVISVSIGLLNLFPIPVLDGGHLLYYAFEAVLGRPLGERAQEVGFRLGLALVLALMLLATFNDLVRFNLF
jgi:regulator of sigma E protease